MERNERLQKAFEYLRYKELVRTQADIASIMNASRSNISSAMNGDTKVLTDRFLKRFNAAFDSVFNIDWLLHGKGNMLSDSTFQNVKGNNNHVAGRDINISNEDFSKLIDTVNKQQEQMGRLISLLENKLNNNK